MNQEGLPHPFTRQRSRSGTSSSEMSQPAQEGSNSLQESLESSATSSVAEKPQQSACGAGQPGEQHQPNICEDPECSTKTVGINCSREYLHAGQNHRADNTEEQYSLRSIGTVRLAKQIKTTELVKTSLDAHSLKIGLKHRHFTAQLYITPAATNPGGTEQRAILTICVQVNHNVKRIPNVESFKISVSTEICDKISGERLDDKNRHPPLQTMSPKGFVCYSQDLILCKKLDVAKYRNDSVEVVFKTQVFIASSFKYRVLEESTDIVIVNIPEEKT